ncbi:MarR family transcriptional regulator [Clostridium sp. BJN0001]|uniref:MarR family winged helix-turn-helix transcriptional regulator n=1 Tax=Clostridium sp. BJN0001 TaxID=2930219 RepID=UPI001FD17D18|nr:MarR family transcriptional regulator [Clostridium sp. BJN0001]
MDKTQKEINELLVLLFNDILQMEENTLKKGVLKDLSITEIHTIEAIGMYSKKTMTEVAQILNITVSTLTTGVGKLIKKGYVERKRIEEDRRVVLITLTHKGRLAYRLHSRFHREMVNTSVEGLSEKEQKILFSSLKKINEFINSKLEK